MTIYVLSMCFSINTIQGWDRNFEGKVYLYKNTTQNIEKKSKGIDLWFKAVLSKNTKSSGLSKIKGADIIFLILWIDKVSI